MKFVITERPVVTHGDDITAQRTESVLLQVDMKHAL